VRDWTLRFAIKNPLSRGQGVLCFTEHAVAQRYHSIPKIPDNIKKIPKKPGVSLWLHGEKPGKVLNIISTGITVDSQALTEFVPAMFPLTLQWPEESASDPAGT
jgi:hypothetical protein